MEASLEETDERPATGSKWRERHGGRRLASKTRTDERPQHMRVVIAGGHGKIALLLTRVLTIRRDEVHSLIRDPAHAADVKAVGAEPVLLDLEHADAAAVATVLEGADAVVFAAG